MTETQTHDNSCPRCGGTGFDLQMDPCPCTPRTFVTAVRPPMDEAVVAAIEAVAAAIEPVTEWAAPSATKRMYPQPASPAQIKLLCSLVAEREDLRFTNAAVMLAVAGLAAGTGLTTRKASELISNLKEISATTPSASVRPNKYAGTCGACHTAVAEGEGRIEKGGAGWHTYHLVGTCPDAAALAALTADAVTEAGVYRHMDTPASAHGFYRVKAGRYGRFYAERIKVGSDGKVRFVRCGLASFLKASERITMSEARAFGVASGFCIFCGASLYGVDGKSAVAGYGETCAKNHRLPYPSTAQMKKIAGGATWDELTP